MLQSPRKPRRFLRAAKLASAAIVAFVASGTVVSPAHADVGPTMWRSWQTGNCLASKGTAVYTNPCNFLDFQQWTEVGPFYGVSNNLGAYQVYGRWILKNKVSGNCLAMNKFGGLYMTSNCAYTGDSRYDWPIMWTDVRWGAGDQVHSLVAVDANPNDANYNVLFGLRLGSGEGGPVSTKIYTPGTNHADIDLKKAF
ncbi:MAG: hypothetical protein ACRYF3_16890 [Janthinobacterium lividum]